MSSTEKWQEKTLGDVCDIEIGGTPSRNRPDFWDQSGDGYIWVSIRDLNEKWITHTAEAITVAGARNSNTKLVPAGTVLMSFKLTLGRVAIAGVDLFTNEAIAAFYPRSSAISSSWLFHILPSVSTSISAEQAVKGVTLNKKKLQLLKIPLPSPEEQALIAAILDTVDDAIRYTEQVIAKLKLVRAGLLHDLLTYGIDENGDLRDPVRNPEQFEDGLPLTWQSSAIEGVSNYVGSGITPRGGREVYVSSGILFIRSQNVQFDGIDLDDIAFIDLKTHERMKNSELQANDVLLNITGASIGRCYHTPEESLPANVNQHVCAIRLQHPTLHDAIYVSAVLGSYIGQSQIIQQNAGGSREGLNYKQVRSLVLPWPQSRNERIEIALRIEAFDRNVSEERIFLSKLLLLKQGLMDDLLTGRVRVVDLLSAED